MHLHYKRTVMEEKNWMLLMEDLSEIRLLSSLILKKARKGAAATAQEVDMLFRVALAKNPIVPGELSHDMGISKTTVSRLIDGLTENGLIEKLYDRQDKRSYSLRITSEGKDELDSMYHYYLEPVYGMREALDEAEFQQFIGLVRKVNLYMAKKQSKNKEEFI